jgi:hypothetical protein
MMVLQHKPNCLVVGAAKAGTTLLYYYLRQHPEVFIPNQKEPCFFLAPNGSFNFVKGKLAFAILNQQKYETLYKKATQSAKLDMSTPYLYHYQTTINNIKLYYGSASLPKIVAVLRNPVDRAFSQYQWRVRDIQECLSFDEALKQEPQRIAEGYSFDFHYFNRGLYASQIAAYKANFREVKVILFEDLIEDPLRIMKELTEFMNVDESFKFSLVAKVNESHGAKFPWLNKLITMESKWKFQLLNTIGAERKEKLKSLFMKANRQDPIKIEPTSRRLLSELYRSDILQLQDLIGRDLSKWLI